jgi:hypothetical protein
VEPTNIGSWLEVSVSTRSQIIVIQRLSNNPLSGESLSNYIAKSPGTTTPFDTFFLSAPAALQLVSSSCSRSPSRSHDDMNYSPSYTLRNTPSPSDSAPRSTPSPLIPSSTPYHLQLPPIPSPSSFNSSYSPFSSSPKSHIPRSIVPTSCPDSYGARFLPGPTPSATASFTSGYASPATSIYSSEPGSQDELDMIEPPFGSHFHSHVSLPGIDDIMSEDMLLDRHQNDSLREREFRRGWNMRDFVLVQTVGMSFPCESSY